MNLEDFRITGPLPPKLGRWEIIMRPEHWKIAHDVALMYTIDNKLHNRDTRNHDRTESTAFKRLRSGLLAEQAVSILTGLPWTPAPPGVFGRCDIDNRIEVKHTDLLDGHLIMPEQSPRNAPHVLVVKPYPRMLCRGWAYGYEIEEHGKFYQNGDSGMSEPQWWLGHWQDVFRPMDSLA